MTMLLVQNYTISVIIVRDLIFIILRTRMTHMKTISKIAILREPNYIPISIISVRMIHCRRCRHCRKNDSLKILCKCHCLLCIAIVFFFLRFVERFIWNQNAILQVIGRKKTTMDYSTLACSQHLNNMT